MAARFKGLSVSGRMRPRTSSSISTGTRVMDSSAAATIAQVLVQASGANSLPSWAPRANTGRKDSAMIISEKNSDGPTSRQASSTSAERSRSSSPACSSFLWTFSTMTMPASTIAPMAIAMPPSDMMLALRPWKCMIRNAARMPSGRVTMITTLERKWNRKAAQTSATTMISSTSLPRRLSTARWISPERS